MAARRIGTGRRTAGALMATFVLVSMWPSMASAATTKGGINGVVTRNGNGLQGALVTLYAWPSAPSLEGLAIGAHVALLRVGRATTGSDGSWLIQARHVPAGYLEPNGVTNFEMTVSDGISRADWTMPLRLSNQGDAWRDQSASSPNGGGVSLAFDLGEQPTVATSGGGGASTTSVLSLARQPGVDLDAQALLSDGTVSPMVGGCYTIAGTIYTGLNEFFTFAYGWSGSTVEVKETTSTTHTLGAGYSYASGPWSQNGTVSVILASASGTDQTGFINKGIYNKVNYRDYARTAPCSDTTRRYYSSYQLLGYTIGVAHSNYPYCGMASTGVYWKDLGTNYTWTNGVDIGPISVSSQSGWDVNTSIIQHFTATSWLCGNNPGGVDQSQQIEAHQY